MTNDSWRHAAGVGGAPSGALPLAVGRWRIGRGRGRAGVAASVVAGLLLAGAGCATVEPTAGSGGAAASTSVRSPSASPPASERPDGSSEPSTDLPLDPMPSSTSSPRVSGAAPATSAEPERVANLDHRGVDLGDACVDPSQLLAAAATLDVAPAVSDLRSIRCFEDWATAWTNPAQDPVEPVDPEVLVFRRTDGGWKAWHIGDGDCTVIGVPADVQVELDCY